MVIEEGASADPALTFRGAKIQMIFILRKYFQHFISMRLFRETRRQEETPPQSSGIRCVKNGEKYYGHRLSQIEKGRLIDSLNGRSNAAAVDKTTLTGKSTGRFSNADADSVYKGMTLEQLLQVPDE